MPFEQKFNPSFGQPSIFQQYFQQYFQQHIPQHQQYDSLCSLPCRSRLQPQPLVQRISCAISSSTYLPPRTSRYSRSSRTHVLGTTKNFHVSSQYSRVKPIRRSTPPLK
ncbi:hypothetical protein DPMN_075684 [Dreissena polymorpha]|uniref:Uncharacterized protein n=1 Tax=Dreissena polymorpha TaxID=45954 RepID=A0A9D3YLK3_DREPO|nr:hypothetical protein DPMN_075684 [Dreissena polymorpha]